MVLKKQAAALEKHEADYATLQWKIRRDPKSYKEDFLKQWEQYEAQREIFLVSPSTATPDSIQSFHDIIDLIAHVADCYPEDTASFASDLKTMLLQHHKLLHPELREKAVGSLVLLRRKDQIDSSSLLTTLFPILVESPSKTMRSFLFNKIISELRNSNSKTTNHPLNRTVQAVMYNLIMADRSSPKALWAVKITRELWKRQIWTDAKPVDVMKEACLSTNEKVVTGAVRFFLGGDQEREALEDEDSDAETIDLKKLQHQMGINKKSKKKFKRYDKALVSIKRQEAKKNKSHPLNFSALHLLHDPQGFAEVLFDKHLQSSKAKLSLDSKLLVLQLVTRLVGLHELTVISLYSWFIKYLTPRQKQVTSFLACLAQGVHQFVPPDAVEPLVQKIANEFVSEASAAEVAAAGLNAIREICVRQPLAMNDTLLQDLVQYRKSKDKGTMMAAKGLLSLFREVDAELLAKKDRGKNATMGIRSGEIKKRKFGEQESGGIEGLELLEQWKEEEKERKRAAKEAKKLAGEDEEEDIGGEKRENGINIDDSDDEDKDGYNSDDWEVESNDSDNSGGWINVEHSDDEDEPATKKAKTVADGEDTKEEDDKPKPLSKLATTTILTPADLTKLQELRLQAQMDKAMGHGNQKRKETQDRHRDEGLTAEQIEAPAKLRKSTKEERVALAAEGKPNREEHKSTKAIRKSKKDAQGKSTTNKDKARKKNFLMTLGKAKSKQKRSLVEAKKILTGHIQRSKRGGRRANGS
ncbi:Severe Depolymerization of Actin [Ceratocystis pirilliformis]|uniref:Protein SDA1 n=1 Tax=Ceratocystis pirilliformis TaxID=259994 RepID=A0ABR3YHQ2_9PEZI